MCAMRCRRILDSHVAISSTPRNLLFGPNLTRTISGVFGINYQIRIRFPSLRNFFRTIRISGVFKVSITCKETVHVLVLRHPRNSMSNVLVSVTIGDLA